jgi:trimeric autotransporter adhesin
VAENCAIDNGGCDPNAQCSQLADGVSCACRAGYSAEGPGCIPLLASLSVSPGFLSPVFSASQGEYRVMVPKGTSILQVSAAAQDATGADVLIDGTKGPTRTVTLSSGETTIHVDVRAKTGSQRWRSTIRTAVGSTSFLQRTGFKPTVSGASMRFGTSVALSADATTAALGAPYDSTDAVGVNGTPGTTQVQWSGAVVVFAKAPTGWAPQAYVKAPNRQPSEQFGRVIALSSDGTTLVVGAAGEGRLLPDGGLSSGLGAAYVFRRTGTAWAQEARIEAPNAEAQDGFGWSVALSGDGNTALVGAPFEDSASPGVNSDDYNNRAPNSGAAYLFSRTGTAWAASGYLKASNTGAGDNFGRAVSISQDGMMLVIGAPGEDSDATGLGNADDGGVLSSGAAYVFHRTPALAFEQMLKAQTPATLAHFGSALSLSSDGTTLAIGSPDDSGGPLPDGGVMSSGGAVYLLRRSNSWSQEARLSGPSEGGDAVGASVSLSADGLTLAAGAPGEGGQSAGVDGVVDNGAPASGAVFLFRKTSAWGSWTAYVKASNTGAGDAFGSAVSLSSNGTTLLVGAPTEDSDTSGTTGDLWNNSAADRGAGYLFQE